MSHIMGPRESQDLRSPSPIMAPALTLFLQDSLQAFSNLQAALAILVKQLLR